MLNLYEITTDVPANKNKYLQPLPRIRFIIGVEQGGLHEYSTSNQLGI